MKADYFLLGAQKAGTTSFFNWVAQHPDCYAPYHLEDYPFFSRQEHYSTGLDRFDQFLTDYNEESAVFVGATDYTRDLETLLRIKQYNKDAKAIFLIRNPLDRAISAFTFMRQIGKETRDSVYEVLFQSMRTSSGGYDLDYMRRGLYAEQIANVLEVFKSDALILVFEEMITSKEATIKRTFEFMGIDNNFVPNFMHSNRTNVPRSKSFNKFLFEDNKLKKFVRNTILSNNVLRSRLRKMAVSINTGSESIKAELSKAERSVLMDFFVDDINKTSKILEKNLLDIWKVDDK